MTGDAERVDLVRLADGIFASLPEGKVEAVDIRAIVRAVEEAYTARALRAACGNKTAAARLLGLKRPTLLARLRVWGWT